MKVKEGESTQLLSCAMHRHNLNITAVQFRSSNSNGNTQTVETTVCSHHRSVWARILTSCC